MKEVNEHLESTPPRWDADLGRWIEPEEFLDTGDDSPNQSNETGLALPQIPAVNAAGVAYPSIKEQENFWKLHDHGGNILPSRIEANEDIYNGEIL